MRQTEGHTKQKKHDTASNEYQRLFDSYVIGNSHHVIVCFVYTSIFCQTEVQPSLFCEGTGKYKGGGGNP